MLTLGSIFCFVANYIDGIEFVSLSKVNIEKIIPQVGMAKQIMRLQPGAISKTVSSLCLMVGGINYSRRTKKYFARYKGIIAVACPLLVYKPLPLLNPII